MQVSKKDRITPDDHALHLLRQSDRDPVPAKGESAGPACLNALANLPPRVVVIGKPRRATGELCSQPSFGSPGTRPGANFHCAFALRKSAGFSRSNATLITATPSLALVGSILRSGTREFMSIRMQRRPSGCRIMVSGLKDTELQQLGAAYSRFLKQTAPATKQAI